MKSLECVLPPSFLLDRLVLSTSAAKHIIIPPPLKTKLTQVALKRRRASSLDVDIEATTLDPVLVEGVDDGVSHHWLERSGEPVFGHGHRNRIPGFSKFLSNVCRYTVLASRVNKHLDPSRYGGCRTWRFSPRIGAGGDAPPTHAFVSNAFHLIVR